MAPLEDGEIPVVVDEILDDDLDDEDENGDAAPPAPIATPSSGPSGPGWVIELRGYHYFNKNLLTMGRTFVRQTLLNSLKDGTIELPDGTYSFKDLGIGYPVMVQFTPPIVEVIDDHDAIAASRLVPADAQPLGRPGIQPQPAADPPKTITVKKSTFIIQFCWQPVSPSQRLANRAAAPTETESGDPTDAPADADTDTADTAADTAAELANTQP